MLTTTRRRLTVLFISMILSLTGYAQGQKELWFYYATNLQKDDSLARLEPIWRRAAAAGYTHVLLTDSKFARLNELGGMEKQYFSNVERVKKLAAELKLQIVPSVFSIGWSNDMLWHNPNLAEGLPVRDALFIVKGGQATVTADPAVGFSPRPQWQDDTVRMEGNMATVENSKDLARFMFRFGLPTYRCYHISVWIKTENFQGKPEIKALAGNFSLQWQSLVVKPTQDWTRHDVVFNTLDNEQISVYFGVWETGKGKLQWKDWKIEEAGLVNVLRRPGAPLTVRTEAGKVCVEGQDFEKVEDPHLGNEPWSGEYRAWHEPPAIKTKLPNGTRLRVSWYHPAIIYDGSVMCCLSEPETTDILQDTVKRVRAAWDAKGCMMAYDEIRILNRDASCMDRKLDAGKLLAEHARMSTRWLEGAQVYVWSDMFDPHHNAHKDYYLVRGDLAGSWEGLDKSVIIVNWNFGERDKSLKFFADRGHRQILAGYYDAPVGQVKAWLDSAARVKAVVGVMYTTWQSNYADLEAFAKLCRQ